MIVKFDFGTQNNVPPDLVADMLRNIQEYAETTGGANVGSMSIYLQLYDNDGTAVDMVNASDPEFKGKCVNFVVRKKPYVRKQKDKVLFLTYRNEETEEPIAYVYKHYTN